MAQLLELSLSCETSNAQSDAEIRSLPKAGYCLTIAFTHVEVGTERIYSRVNGDPWMSIQGGRQNLAVVETKMIKTLPSKVFKRLA